MVAKQMRHRAVGLGELAHHPQCGGPGLASAAILRGNAQPQQATVLDLLILLQRLAACLVALDRIARKNITQLDSLAQVGIGEISLKSHTNNIATGRWALPFCIDEMRISISEILPTNSLERQDTL